MTIPIKSSMQVQSGATLSATGTGVINATAIQGTSVSGVTGTGNLVLSASPSLTGTTSAVNISVSGTLADGTSSVGTSGQILSSTVTGTAWISQSALSIAYSQVTGHPQLAQTFTPVTNEFLTGYTSSTGVFTAAQPSFSGISGTVTVAQLASTEGSGSKVQLTNAGTTVNGDVVTYDGSGNVQDSGTLLSSLATTASLSSYALTSSLSVYALLASPTFTGTVTLPTVTLSGTMTVGTGASITVSGTGSVEATKLQSVSISATAPSIAGQVLTSTSTSAAAWQTPTSSVATGSNVVIAATRTSSTDGGYGTLSVIKQLKAGNLLSLPASWKFSLVFNSGAGYVINAVVYRTLIDSTTIVDSTAVTFGGLSTGTLNTAGEFFSDAISLQLDTSHDYYITIYFQSGSGNLTIWTPGAILQNNYNTGYVSGNKSTLTTGGTIPSVSPEETVYRVIAT